MNTEENNFYKYIQVIIFRSLKSVANKEIPNSIYHIIGNTLYKRYGKNYDMLYDFLLSDISPLIALATLSAYKKNELLEEVQNYDHDKFSSLAKKYVKYFKVF